jgi:hypothetical protein
MDAVDDHIVDEPTARLVDQSQIYSGVAFVSSEQSAYFGSFT